MVGLGLPRGSGAVESAIRRVINLRIKGASIYWLPESVDAILLLRSFYKSGQMELFAADGHDAGGCERVTGKSGMRPTCSMFATNSASACGGITQYSIFRWVIPFFLASAGWFRG